MPIRRKVSCSLAMVLACAVVTGCNPNQQSKSTVHKIDIESVLPVEYQNLGKQPWSARYIAEYPLPHAEEWGGYYADPFFPLVDWEKPTHDPKAKEFIDQISDWQIKSVGQTNRISELDDDAISRVQQEAVGALLAKSRVQTVAAATPDQAVETWKQAWNMAKEAVTTGPGAEGLNQNVLLFLCAQAALDIAKKQPTTAVELAKALEVDILKIAQAKLKENVVVDVMPRIKILAGGEALLGQAALILDPEGVTDQADTMVAAAAKADGTEFDAAATLKLAVQWTDDFVNALDKNWLEAEKSLLNRSKIVSDSWQHDVLNLNTDKFFEYKAPEKQQLLPKLFAHNLAGSITPMVESAIDTQINVDAARMSLMVQAAKAKGINPKSYEDLAKIDPAFKAPLIDPLTHQPYLVDFTLRTLRTPLKSVGKNHFLLSSIVQTGANF